MSTPKNCSAIENELALFVGGELGPRSRAEVEEHLQRCEACVGAVGRLARARAALRAGLSEGASRVPDLWAGVRARLVESGTIHAAPQAPQAPGAPAAQLVAAATPRRNWIPLSAAAAALFALGLWLAQRDDAGTEKRTGGPDVVSRQIEVQPVGLRRLQPGESALSSSAVSIEELQDEARQRAALQPGGAQAASQVRGMH